jgi:hypothetical protein
MENVNGELLINLVRLHPYLFNKTDKRYKDIRIKENAWEEIGQTLLVTGFTFIKLFTCTNKLIMIL